MSSSVACHQVEHVIKSSMLLEKEAPAEGRNAQEEGAAK